jgi:hypothetical protein
VVLFLDENLVMISRDHERSAAKIRVARGAYLLLGLFNAGFDVL